MITTHFVSPIEMNTKLTHGKPVHNYSMILKLEHDRLRNSKQFSLKDIQAILPKSYTLIEWSDSEGKQHSDKVYFD